MPMTAAAWITKPFRPRISQLRLVFALNFSVCAARKYAKEEKSAAIKEPIASHWPIWPGSRFSPTNWGFMEARRYPLILAYFASRKRRIFCTHDRHQGAHCGRKHFRGNIGKMAEEGR